MEGRENGIAEATDAIHDAVHDAIEEATEANRIKDVVMATGRNLLDRPAEPAPDPDYIFDPDDWECTYEYKDRSYLTDDMPGDLWEPRRFETLIKGPDRWAVEVVISTDDNGDPDETEIRWFETEAEAQAAKWKQK